MNKIGLLNSLGVPKKIADWFHRLYYTTASRTWENTYWMGTKVRKIPFDLWVYQEIIAEIKPDLIIETGTDHGGSALYMANLMDLMNHGEILTIDILTNPNRPIHPRITYLTGSSVDVEIVAQAKKIASKAQKVLVILDSDHSYRHVKAELAAYSSFVTKGSYLIVEDGNINGHPIARGCGAGPFEAIEEFMKNQNDFEIDLSREKFYVTFNPNGYLKRK
jgi:cephalosporin hydroxylase